MATQWNKQLVLVSIVILLYSCTSNQRKIEIEAKSKQFESKVENFSKDSLTSSVFIDSVKQFTHFLQQKLEKRELATISEYVDFPLKEDKFCILALIYPEKFDSLYFNNLLNTLPQQLDRNLFIEKEDKIFPFSYVGLISWLNQEEVSRKAYR